jgi:hypothetical protein
MIAEISAALSTIKALADLSKTLRNATQDEAVRSSVFDIQNDLLSVQAKLFEANARFEEQSAENAALKEKLASIRRCDETKARHEIVELYPGRYAYKLRSPTGSLEKNLRYCATCFDSGKLSLLQERGNLVGVYECPVCKYQLAPPKNRR